MSLIIKDHQEFGCEICMESFTSKPVMWHNQLKQSERRHQACIDCATEILHQAFKKEHYSSKYLLDCPECRRPIICQFKSSSLEKAKKLIKQYAILFFVKKALVDTFFMKKIFFDSPQPTSSHHELVLNEKKFISSFNNFQAGSVGFSCLLILYFSFSVYKVHRAQNTNPSIIQTSIFQNIAYIIYEFVSQVENSNNFLHMLHHQKLIYYPVATAQKLIEIDENMFLFNVLVCFIPLFGILVSPNLEKPSNFEKSRIKKELETGTLLLKSS